MAEIKDMGHFTVGAGANPQQPTSMTPQQVAQEPGAEAAQRGQQRTPQFPPIGLGAGAVAPGANGVSDIILDIDTPRAIGDGIIRLPSGITIHLIEPKGSVQFRAAMIIPPDKSENMQLLRIVQLVLYIARIDSVPVSHLTFESVQATVERLGDEGLAFLQHEVTERYPANPALRKKMERIQNLLAAPY